MLSEAKGTDAAASFLADRSGDEPMADESNEFGDPKSAGCCQLLAWARLESENRNKFGISDA